MNLAPIALFVYNRPQHAQQTLEALAANLEAQDSVLYIFADGAKANASTETLQGIKETRELIKSKKWCKEVYITERNENFGLAKSIIEGVTSVISKHGKIIVLEDDIVCSPYFLKYMNTALDKFENENKVNSISAYSYPVANLPDLFFIEGADCWGWATWKRAWSEFETDGKLLLNDLKTKKLSHKFDFNSTYPYTKMLSDQIEGKNNSWAIRWHASCFLKGKLCLYPGKSLVHNIGTEGSGTHSGSSNLFDTIIYNKEVPITAIPVQASETGFRLLSDYFKAINWMQSNPTPVFSIKSFIKQLLPASIVKLIKKQ